jgi:hypothetical protein
MAGARTASVMSQIREAIKARPWVGWLLFFCVAAIGAGVAAEQQAMKLSDGTFATKVVVYTLDGSPASAGAGDASAANQTTQITHLSAIETATEAAQASLDTIETNLSADAVHGNAVIATGPQMILEAKDFDGAALPNTVTEGQSIRAAGSMSGVKFVMLVNEDGSAVGSVAQSGTWNVGLNAGTNGIGKLTANSGVDIGDVDVTSISAGTNYIGKTRLHDGTNDALVDPCQSVTKTTTAFSQTSIANIITADAAKTNYICSIVIVASAAEVVSVVEDDTSGCGSLTAALAGSTTAANGMSLAANGGFTLGNGESTVLKGSANNRYLCIAQDGADRISGSITWVQR